MFFLVQLSIFAFWLFSVDCTTGKLNLLGSTQQLLGSACLDGSPPAYYFAPGFGSGARKWFLFHQGGGWCTNLTDCYDRSKTPYGSSVDYSPTMDLGGGFFSEDPTVNPLLYNWNKVRFQYCDGASFSGNNAIIQDYQGKSIYFRGFHNLKAYLHDLTIKYGLQQGTDFIISGCSAGGLATFLHADWWAQNLPPRATVKGVPDSGFFLDYDSTIPGGPLYSTDMKWAFNAQNCSLGVNQKCIAAHQASGNTELCFFAEHSAPFIQTELFLLQSRFDSWDIPNILGSSDADQINEYGLEFDKRVKATVLANPKNGCFYDSCFHHCGAWNEIRIDGILSGEAIKNFYEGNGNSVYLQVEDYPCDTCCKP